MSATHCVPTCSSCSTTCPSRGLPRGAMVTKGCQTPLMVLGKTSYSSMHCIVSPCSFMVYRDTGLHVATYSASAEHKHGNSVCHKWIISDTIDHKWGEIHELSSAVELSSYWNNWCILVRFNSYFCISWFYSFNMLWHFRSHCPQLLVLSANTV